MPHLLATYSTMSRPRPPSAETLACVRAGLVAAPPSLTATSIASSSSAHATCTFAPGSGLACLMALLRSSLTTSTASPTAVLKIPAALRSAATRWRATATLAGAQGSNTVPAALTSRAGATRARQSHTDPLRRRCPASRSRNRHLTTRGAGGRSRRAVRRQPANQAPQARSQPRSLVLRQRGQHPGLTCLPGLPHHRRRLATRGRQVKPHVSLVGLVTAAPDPPFALQAGREPADRALVEPEQPSELALGDAAGGNQLDQRPGLRGRYRPARSLGRRWRP